MSTSTYTPTKGASTTITISPENIASSSGFTAGVESNSIACSAYSDIMISGLWTAGTTPTINTQVQAWIVWPRSDNQAGTIVWPDVFDGTGSAETATSAGVLQSFGVLLGVINIDATTSNRPYDFGPKSLASFFGGRLPFSSFALFVTHNSGANSNSTGGNHAWYYTPITDVWTF